jgi:hypothetical protein
VQSGGTGAGPSGTVRNACVRSSLYDGMTGCETEKGAPTDAPSAVVKEHTLALQDSFDREIKVVEIKGFRDEFICAELHTFRSNRVTQPPR